jgi:hypothetical protein
MKFFVYFQHESGKKWIRLENLSFATRYEVKFRYKEDSISSAEVFETLGEKHEPLEVRQVLVPNYVSGAGDALYANVSWTPAAGEFKCTHYLNNLSAFAAVAPNE